MSSTRALLLAVALAVPVFGVCADLGALSSECESCHGPSGVSGHSEVPTIAGQPAEFIRNTLSSYQQWGRPCTKSAYRYGDTSRPATDMCQVAEKLSLDEIDALSAHYAALDFVPAEQEFDAALAAAGKELHEERCESCHEQGGTGAGYAPIIAGQWTDYLRKALSESTTGEHLVPPPMERKITDASSEELEALMNYYASRR